MGLDMYLEKHTYVQNWDHTDPQDRHTVTVKGPEGAGIKPERVSHIIETVFKWRKANAIHGWFVKNVQDGVDDCKTYYVDREKLEELLALLNEALGRLTCSHRGTHAPACSVCIARNSLKGT